MTAVSNQRLNFVLFALLLLISVPVFTGLQWHTQQAQMSQALKATQQRMDTLKQALHSNTDPERYFRAETAASQALSTLIQQQGQTDGQAQLYRAVQIGLTFALGALGLIAYAYTRHALRAMRHNIAERDSERQKLRAVFHTVPVGITLWNRQGQLIDVNSAALHILGQPTLTECEKNLLPTEGPGALHFRQAEGALFDAKTDPIQRAIRGEMFADVEANVTRPDGANATLLFSGCPVSQPQADGTPLFVTVFQDITARRDSERQIEILADITTSINATHDVPTMLEAFLSHARKLLPCDRAYLALRVPSARPGWTADTLEEEEEETELMRHIRGRGIASNLQTATQRVTQSVQHEKRASGPERAAFAQIETWCVEGDAFPTAEFWTPEQEIGPLGRVLENGRPLLLDSAARRKDSDLQNSLSPADANSSLLVVPLQVSAGIVGALQLECDAADAYSPAMLRLAQQAAGQLASAVQNILLYQEATRRTAQLEWAMQETHHRIKNNLQMVSSLLDMYRMDFPSGSAPADAFNHLLREINTIAAVHELLNEDARVAQVNIRHLMERLTPMLLSGPITLGRRVHADVQAEELMVPSKMASALALAANELIANAVQHGGQGRDAVDIRVRVRRTAGRLQLIVCDDGPGFPPGFDSLRAAQIGLSLVQTLIVRDHNGALHFDNEGGGIATASVPFVERNLE